MVLQIGCRQQLIRLEFAKQPRRPSWNAKQMFSNILGMSRIAVCNQISAQGTKCFAIVGSAKKVWWTPSFALAIFSTRVAEAWHQDKTMRTIAQLTDGSTAGSRAVIAKQNRHRVQ
jgi:hypothetical protein